MRIPGTHLVLAAFAALFAVGCSSSADECEPTGVIMPGGDIAALDSSQVDTPRWRQNIENYVASLPAASVVLVVVMYRSDVTDDDRALLDELDVQIKYEFTQNPWLTIWIRAGNLLTLADSDRIVRIEIPARGVQPGSC